MRSWWLTIVSSPQYGFYPNQRERDLNYEIVSKREYRNPKQSLVRKMSRDGIIPNPDSQIPNRIQIPIFNNQTILVFGSWLLRGFEFRIQDFEFVPFYPEEGPDDKDQDY